MHASTVHRTKISEYELDKTIPKLDTIEKLAKALQMSMATLLEGVGWQPKAGAEESGTLRR